MEKLTCIDLFAGCGGLSLGLSQAGWSGLFAIEKDPMAFETLSKNLIGPNAPYNHYKKWPNWLPKSNINIKDLLANSKYRNHLKDLDGKVALIAGGPPCQGFSIGGARRGHDERNELVFDFLELVSLVHPKMVLIENVEGMARAFKTNPGNSEKSVLELVIKKLNSLGYKANFLIVKALDAGVPQGRIRVLTLGIKKELADEYDPAYLLQRAYQNSCFLQRKSLGLPTDRPITVAEAIHDLAGDEYVECPDSPNFNSCRYLKADSVYAKLMRCGAKIGAIPNSHRFSKHGKKVLQLYIKAHKTQKPGRLPKSFLLKNNTKTKKKFLLGKDIYASTLTTHPDENIHYLYPRNVSLREMARLQSFPDNFHFFGRYTLNGERRKLDVSRCAQIGNAVPPLMARAIGSAIIGIYDSLLSKNKEDRLLKILAPKKQGENLSLFA